MDEDKKELTLGSLFDGSGGFPLGGIIAGIKPLWASEIEPYPIRVTTKRIPEMKHLGDVAGINGAEIEPVDIITFGSPCFPAGTLVLTDKGYIEIENIKVGMQVLTHEGRYRKVTAVGSKQGKTIILNDDELHKLECTPNHPIYSINTDNTDLRDWVNAENMLGRYWAIPNEIDNTENKSTIKDNLHTWYKVRNIEETNEIKTVYNLTVEEDNSYIADGIVVHNCQDMSIAGKRQGLEGSRSNLFYEAIRIIKEMREATNGEYPRYAVWENVPGAFSSNGGEDFRAVLESLCSVCQAGISIPQSDQWNSAGEILGNNFSLAWRMLDAQYWGVPQRRRRIYLVTDFRGRSAGKILFESEGVSGYSAESFRAWQRTTNSIKKALETQAQQKK